jgi:hypothetical protein
MGIRSKWAKTAVDHLRVFWQPPAGYATWQWMKLEDGRLKLPEKFGVKRREFSISELSTRPIKYPFGFPSFLQITAHSIVLDTESYEPISNRSGLLTLSPLRLANIFNTDVISSTNQKMINTDEKASMPVKKGGIPTLVWIIIIVLLVALVGVGVYYAMNGQIEELKAGLGVQ